MDQEDFSDSAADEQNHLAIWLTSVVTLHSKRVTVAKLEQYLIF
jgi:hypothetical protein